MNGVSTKALTLALAAATGAATIEFLPNEANAATTPNSAVMPQTPNLGVITSSGSGNFTVYTGSANGSMCTGVWATNLASGTAYTLNVYVTRSSTNYLQTTVGVTGGAGLLAGVATVNLFNSASWPGLPLDNYGNPYIYLKNASDSITVTPTTSASTNIQITAVCADF